MHSVNDPDTGSKLAFLLIGCLCLAPLFPLPVSIASIVAPSALIAGALTATLIGNPFASATKPLSRSLLQASVVLLGFSMDVSEVVNAGRSGLLLSLVSISVIFALGWLLQRRLAIRPVTGLLVSAGTAICGGSAIAAVSTVVDAKEEDVSVAAGTIFLLNAVALLAFPVIGRMLHLSQRAFGTWSGIAIQDIASVVGAGSAYGAEALKVATAVKLSRVLYLVPVTFLISMLRARSIGREEGGRSAVKIPWFVALFLIASLIRNVVPATVAYTSDVRRLASAGFALSLFLIGSALTKATIRSVGPRPLLLGLLLWIFISVSSLAAIAAWP